ncbi:MAG: hypothetical protein OXH83_18660 [Bryobacterales bacterium]|nr:hypothetical protein [Bryobacterales bacterium]
MARRLELPDWFSIVAGVVSFLIIVLLYCVFLFQAGRRDQAASGDPRSSTQQQQTLSFSGGAARSLEAAPNGDADDTTAEAIARFTRWMMATWEIENPVLDVLLDGGELELYVNQELASPMRHLTCPQGREVAELLLKKWSIELGRTASGFTMRDSQGVILLRHRYRALGLGGVEYHCGMDSATPDQVGTDDLRSSTQQQQTLSLSSDAARSRDAAPDDDAEDTTVEAIARFTQWMMTTWEIENPVLDVLLDGGELELYVNRELASPMRRLTCPEGREVAELLFKKWSIELGRTASGFTMRDSQGVILLRYRYRALGLGGLEYHCGMD